MFQIKDYFYKKLAKINLFGISDAWMNKTRGFNGVFEITIDIASSCNAKCPFCPRQQENITSLPSGIMKEEVFYEIFDQIKKMDNLRTVSLYAFGEPLLNNNVGNFIKKLRSVDKNIVLSTNTTNLEKHIDDLMDVDLLQFSIEGWDKESYEKYRAGLNFEATLSKLKLLDEKIKERKEKGLKVPKRQIGLLLTKKTKLIEFVELWAPYVDTISINPMFPTLGWDKEKQQTITVYNNDLIDEYFILKERKPLNYCTYVFNKITLNSDGKVVLCCAEFQHDLNLGDYKDLKKAFHSKTIKELRRSFSSEKGDGICNGCVYNYKINQDEILEYFPELNNLQELSQQKGVSIIYG